MINPENVENGVQSIDNPYGLLLGEHSCNAMCDIEFQKLYFVRLNSDETIDISVRSEPSKWKRLTGSTGQYEFRIIKQGEKYQLDGLYMSIMEDGKLLKNIYPGQVYDIYKNQLVIMPIPSSKPLVRLLQQYGMQESCIKLVDDVWKYQEDVYFKKFLFGESVLFCTFSGALPKVYINESLCNFITADVLSEIKENMPGYGMWFHKPTWLLVAEMNLAEKLGPAVVEREKLVALVKEQVELLASRCHPLFHTETDKHMEHVSTFVACAVLEENARIFNPFNLDLNLLGGQPYKLIRDSVGGAYGDLSSPLPSWHISPILVDSVYTVSEAQGVGLGSDKEKYKQLFSININDWHGMINGINEGLKNI